MRGPGMRRQLNHALMNMATKPILIKNGEVWREGEFRRLDILVRDGRIAAVGDRLDCDGCETIDAAGLSCIPGLVDVHVHLREPGLSYKETIATGTAAAAAGGFTTVCAMPNVNPVPDSRENLERQLEIIRRDAVVEVLPYAAITEKRMGRECLDYAALADDCAGFSDDGTGVQDEEVMRKAMRGIAASGKILAAHCEVESLLNGGYIHDGEYCRRNSHRGICSESEWREVERDIRLAEETGCPLHICHVSTKESLDLIRDAKRRGVKVTAETGPHYFAFCDEDLQEDGRFKMNPPLRTAADRDALIRGIQDGTIEVIATDHAPHTAEEKSRGLKGSAMGIVGLETAFAVVYTELVRKGAITIERMIELMCDNPRRIFRLGGGLRVGEAADIAVFDIATPYRIDSSGFLSAGRATPFEGCEVCGECLLTLKDGETVWKKR